MNIDKLIEREAPQAAFDTHDRAYAKELTIAYKYYKLTLEDFIDSLRKQQDKIETGRGLHRDVARMVILYNFKEELGK